MRKDSARTMRLMAACLAVGACSRPPLTYDLSPQEAYARLERADIAGFRFARQCGILIHLTAQKEPGAAITWHVTSSGRPVARFTVRLEPAAGGTRAVIAIPAAPDGGEIYDGNKTYPRPALNQPLRPAIAELVEAAMARRAYDGTRLGRTDRVCSIQRAGLESGIRFSVDDDPGSDSAETAINRWRAASAANPPPDDFAAPMDNGSPP